MSSSRLLRHLTVVANQTDSTVAGALNLSAGTPSPRVFNSIVFDNSPLNLSGARPGSLSHCLYEGAVGTGNGDAAPRFASYGLLGGQWSSAPSFDPQRLQTRLTHTGAAFGDLSGWFVRPSPDDGRWAYVVESDGDGLWVYGDFTRRTAAGQDYTLYNLRLAADSPAIDAADDLEAPARDLVGIPRFDVAGVGAATADMGAYEWQP